MSMQMEKPMDRPSGKLKEGVRDVVVEPAGLVQNIGVDPREIDRQLADMQRAHQLHQARRNPVSQNHGYGIDYSPLSDSTKRIDYALRDGEDIMESSLKPRRPSVVDVAVTFADKQVIINDNDSDHLSQATTVVLEWKEVNIDSSDEETFVPSPDQPLKKPLKKKGVPVVTDPELRAILNESPHPTRGACETLWVQNDECQMLLVAMAQGLWTVDGDAAYPGLMFDIENDELLKTFRNKGTVLPKLLHLQEECTRRSLVFDLPRIKKSAKKNELIAWLKRYPLEEPTDVMFVRHEINKTYRAIKRQSDEGKAAERNNLVSRTNWIMGNWLRLYCCAIDDEARTFLLVKDDCMEHDELDARNHEERPDTWYGRTAKLYNSTKTYVTLGLPELHIDFAYPRTLKFADLPGGPITEAEVKSKLAEARAKLIVIISKWERSGNGFGQRDESNEDFGHVESGKGDNRADFLRDSLGQKSHHLYLWHLSDIMGVLKNVLSVLSQDVAGDSRHYPRDLASTQNKRSRAAGDDVVVEGKKQVFRDEITSTLREIGAGMKEANAIQARAVASQERVVLDANVASLRVAISDEESKLERFTFRLLGEDPTKNPGLVAELERLICRHDLRLRDYETQMQEKLYALKSFTGSG